MKIEITIPSPGESIAVVTIGNWLVDNGSFVEKDQEIGEIESDKATLPLIAKDSGVIEILIPSGTEANVGDIACTINTDQKRSKVKEKQKTIAKEKENTIESADIKSLNSNDSKTETTDSKTETTKTHLKISPLGQKMMDENELSLDDLINGLKRIGKHEVEKVLEYLNQSEGISTQPKEATREIFKEKLSPLRKKLSERLVSVKNQTAMLTTFNEVDMSNMMDMRKIYQEKFIEKFGIKLGLMSFFTKAASMALNQFPNVNSMIDGDEIIHFRYADIGIAVQTDKGLMVPVIRNTETLGLAQIEKEIADLAVRARKFRISIDDMSGGTFSITNGGVFGSMFSTPILNPPQAAILGMHNIVERPVAINGKVEIRPIMFVALSYDHRIVDGRDSVGFLKAIKEMIENPLKMLTEGKNPETFLLGL